MGHSSLFDMFDGLMIEYIPLKFKMEDQKNGPLGRFLFGKARSFVSCM